MSGPEIQSKAAVRASILYGVMFLAFYLGCLGCNLLQVAGMQPIPAAALLGFAVTFLPLPAQLDPKNVQLAFCTGTFIGMSSPQIIENPLQVLAVSLLGGVIYVLAKPHFTGLGGKLGAMAFVATAAWLCLRVVL